MRLRNTDCISVKNFRITVKKFIFKFLLPGLFDDCQCFFEVDYLRHEEGSRQLLNVCVGSGHVPAEPLHDCLHVLGKESGDRAGLLVPVKQVRV
jgi:hypothetical protein